MKDYSGVNEKISLKIKEVRELKKVDEVSGKKLEDKLILSLSYLVHSITRDYKKYNNYEDLQQEGMMGLIKAVQHYDTNTTFHFTRYAIWWIRTRIMRSIKKLDLVTFVGEQHMKLMAQHSLDERIFNDEANPESNVILDDDLKRLNDAIEALSEEQQRFVNMRFGTNKYEAHSLQQLGNKLNMKRDGIRVLESNILAELKNNYIK